MAISYLRAPSDPAKAAQRVHRRLTAQSERPGNHGRYYVGVGLLVVVGVVAVLAVMFVTSKASLSGDSSALVKIGMPLGGGTIESVSVVHGPHSARIPVELRGREIWPLRKIPAHQTVEVNVTIKRPGWVSWLTGKTEHLRLRLTAPSASLKAHYLTLKKGENITLAFKQPVKTVAWGAPGHMQHHVLKNPQANVTVPRPAEAGTMSVSATMRSWESAKSAIISWFPAGTANATAVSSPAPGQTITPHTKLTLTFSKPVSTALKDMPAVTPAGSGSWKTVNSHTIQFTPTGYGYGLSAHVSLGLPSGVRLIGGQGGSGSWTVPGGSTTRLQQLLSILGYLPFNFHYAGAKGVPTTPQAQEAAAIKSPDGKFKPRYPNTPSALLSMWSPGTLGEMTKGALMSFENDHAMTADGVAGAQVWRTLIDAVDHGKKSSFGYTYVSVSKESSPESVSVWHSGKTVVSAPVNTGIASAPTASGTFAVFEHLPVTTMSGTNPDGSHYSDPGIQYVSYFNGGDALHAFTRAQFGFPQSLGCVEMSLGDAAAVYPYTPIGTLVSVN